MTDCHAQLMPIYFREPNVNLGHRGRGRQGAAPRGRAPAEGLRRAAQGSAQAHAFTYLDFAQAAKTYGKVGGFAHLATLVKNLKASRPGALLLDGGDTWQGSATALWSKGQDMVDACKALGVDVMTGHWEFTLGAERVKQIVDKDFKGKVDFVAQNVVTADFGDPVFAPYVIKQINGVPVAIVGPGVPVHADRQPAPPGAGLDLRHQGAGAAEGGGRGAGEGRAGRGAAVAQRHGRGPQARRAASPASTRSSAGHTHDGVPQPVEVKNAKGVTLVTNAGSNGKFLGVMDFDVKGGKVAGWKYRLLPVFANLLAPDPAMARRHREDPRPARGEARARSSPSPRACSIAAATSTARSTR